MRYTPATQSDFARNKISTVQEMHEKQLNRVLEGIGLDYCKEKQICSDCGDDLTIHPDDPDCFREEL
tara:strand:- start:529 stop:729 length:201 start_codon:yes stop_codon:yes gene_type:complete